MAVLNPHFKNNEEWCGKKRWFKNEGIIEKRAAGSISAIGFHENAVGNISRVDKKQATTKGNAVEKSVAINCFKEK